MLEIKTKGESVKRSEAIINTLIEVFNEDGISDRQLVSESTMKFIDERFVFLAESTIRSVSKGCNVRGSIISHSIPSLANSVCEVNAGIRPSNKAIMIVDVQKIICSFFIFVLIRQN